MTITLTKDARYFGLYCAKSGKRRVIFSQPGIELALRVEPSDAAVRQVMNDSTGPGDELANETTKVRRA